MSNNTNQLKTVVRGVRMSEAEYLQLNQLAKQSYLSMSDYIRQCVFEERLASSGTEQPESQSKHDIEMMKLAVHIFTLVKEVGRSSLPEDKYRASIDLANKMLKQWGYDE